MNAKVDIAPREIEEFCERHNIVKLSFFGSVLRDDFGPDSDVDVLVEFEPDAVVGLLDLAQMELELAGLLGRKADIRTPAELSRYFRAKVLASSEPKYVRRR